MRRSSLFAWGYIGLLTAALAVSFAHATIYPMDDHFHYQRFVEELARGHLDLRIPGFHGTNIIVVPWFWLSGSHLAQIHVQIASAILLPLLAFLAARALFRSTWHGVVFASVIAMMPFLGFGSLRGWMVATYNAYLFLTIFLAARGSRWVWLPWGLAMISLPFAIALLPLVFVLVPAKHGAWHKRYAHLIAAFCVPALYLLLQLIQAGHISIGVHQDFSATSIWAGPRRIFLNAAHGLQMLFSIHNYYFPDPVRTGHGNVMHTSPILIMLGLLGGMAWKTFFVQRATVIALLLGGIIGIGMNVMIDHMDHFYMDTGILLIVLAALPVLRTLPFCLPLVLATLHFQWFYFYLNFREPFQLDPWFFLTPAIVDICFVLFCITRLSDIRAALTEWWRGSALAVAQRGTAGDRGG
ncbi:hypothetical protein HYW84_04410 [Candidatus Peregrinibacteria bacterium]|nr:hypothetical protein [Candidatus Peregrinibacteria bacterium]